MQVEPLVHQTPVTRKCVQQAALRLQTVLASVATLGFMVNFQRLLSSRPTLVPTQDCMTAATTLTELFSLREVLTLVVFR